MRLIEKTIINIVNNLPILKNIVETINEDRDLQNKKWEALSIDKNSIYNRIIIKNFVPREFKYYGSKRKKYYSIKYIKSEIESKRFPKKNIIITGAAGMGKTTAVKWLFLNSKVQNTKYIYLNNKSFSNCDSFECFFINLSHKIPNNESCIIFLDGLDELTFIRGKSDEWEKITEFINGENDNNSNCRFVISTRPEHFEFYNLFVNKEIKKTPDKYAIFEIQMLTKKEAFDSCYLVKKLNALDQEKGYKHFINKWPTEEMDSPILTEKQYLQLLKEYLNSMAIEDSFFNSPLICRYAYQIICDWYSQRHTLLVPTTMSGRIYSVLNSIIKWEFHDHCIDINVENSLGKKSFEKYKKEVFNFLAQVASIMGNKGYIDKKQWCDLKKNLKTNDALCVLQEELNGNLEFMHKVFEDYFLAYFFSKTVNWECDSEKLGVFTTLLNSNNDFGIMYIEQLVEGSNDLSKKICNEIIKYENTDTKRFLEYAKGIRWFVFPPTISFSIEEYLSVFPNGACIYAGNIFNKETVKRLQKNGILEIRDAGYLAEFNKDIMFKTYNIVGIQSILPNIKNLSTHFFLYLNSEFKSLYGLLVGNKDSIGNNAKERQEEHNKMIDCLQIIVNFLGENNAYWCLFHNSYIYVYQIIPENEENMTDIFNKGKLNHMYGIYNAKIKNETEILQKSHFYKVEDVPFVFDAKLTLQQNSESGLIKYYDTHLEVINLLNNKIRNVLNKKLSNEKLLKIKELIKKTISEKLQLYFINECLFLLYLLEYGEDMVILAQNTLNLCEKYDHLDGISFRKFLLQDDICFTGNDLDKVYEFAKEHIWI